jgi:hypothetical protein
MTDDPDDYFTEAGQARADASYQRLQKRQARLLVLTRQATDRNATEDEYQVADRSQPA